MNERDEIRRQLFQLVEETGKSVQELRIDASFEHVFDMGDIINDIKLQAKVYVLINRFEEELFTLDKFIVEKIK